LLEIILFANCFYSNKFDGMRLTLRLFASKDNPLLFEYNWNDRTASSVENYTTKDKKEIESFRTSWESLVFRVKDSSLQDPIIQEELKKKSTWLGNLLGYETLQLDIKLKWKEFIFISEPEFITLPIGLLTWKGKFLSNQVNIFRKMKIYQRNQMEKKNQKNIFFFQTNFGGELQSSLEEEFLELSKLPWKNGQPIFLKNQMAREERLKEYLPISKTFYLGSHIEEDSLVLPDGSKISYKEIETWNLSGLDFAFLNGCHSGGSLAKSFLSSGTKSYIGYGTSIPNEIAQKIGINFWKVWNQTNSISKSIVVIQEMLKDSIFQFSFLYFVSQESKPNKSKFYMVGLGFLALIFGVFTIFFSNQNSILNNEVGQGNNKKENNINSLDFPNKSKKNEMILTKPKKMVLKDKKKDLKEPDQNVVEIPESKHTLIETKTNLIQKIKDNQFQAKLIQFIEDDSEILSKNERESLVYRILRLNIDESQKKSMFHRETGR
jgi:hypothetical protein